VHLSVGAAGDGRSGQVRVLRGELDDVLGRSDDRRDRLGGGAIRSKPRLLRCPLPQAGIHDAAQGGSPHGAAAQRLSPVHGRVAQILGYLGWELVAGRGQAHVEQGGRAERRQRVVQRMVVRASEPAADVLAEALADLPRLQRQTQRTQHHRAQLERNRL